MQIMQEDGCVKGSNHVATLTDLDGFLRGICSFDILRPSLGLTSVERIGHRRSIPPNRNREKQATGGGDRRLTHVLSSESH